MKTSKYLGEEYDSSIVVFEGNDVKVFHLSKNRDYSFGRKTNSNQPDIYVNSDIVSREHGYFTFGESYWLFCCNNKVVYYNNKIANYTYLNDRKIAPDVNLNEKRVDPRVLESGDIIRIDTDDLNNLDKYNRGVSILFLEEKLPGEWIKKELHDGRTYIGRNEKNDIQLKSQYISDVHCYIQKKGKKVVIHDEKSANGIWYNGELIEGSIEIKDQDSFAICDRHFFYNNGMLIYNDTSKSNMSSDILINANIKSKKINGIELLKDVRLEINKGSLVAVVGQTGAGKSTLVNCINGMDNSLEGSITFDKENLIKNFKRLRQLISSVPQKPVLQDDMNVEKFLKIEAQKRGIKDYSNVVKKLCLDGVMNKKIRACSGGEKARINMAIELMTSDKKLYCFDEPTSALDANTKRRVFSIFREKTRMENTTIIVITHDLDELDMFDQIVVMSKDSNSVGRLVYSGSPVDLSSYFEIEEIGLPVGDVCKIMMEKLNEQQKNGQNSEKWIDKWREVMYER